MRDVIFRSMFLLLCAVAALIPLLSRSVQSSLNTPPEWPEEFEGRSLYRLPLSDMEERFNAGFPGHVARFSDGHRQVILRWINAGTRKLHSSADCFRGVGYVVTPAPALLDGAGTHWSGFIATRGPHRLRVRERIAERSERQAWTDVSAWYWSTLTQRSRGPWMATTVVETPSRESDGSAD